MADDGVGRHILLIGVPSGIGSPSNDMLFLIIGGWFSVDIEAVTSFKDAIDRIGLFGVSSISSVILKIC